MFLVIVCFLVSVNIVVYGFHSITMYCYLYVFCVFCLFLVIVSLSVEVAVDCVQRLVSEMTRNCRLIYY